MHIKRDKNYWVYVAIYVVVCIFLLILYVFGRSVSLSLAILINCPVFLIAIISLISTGRTFIMDELGCVVCIGKYRKMYMWEELKTKRIEKYDLPSMLRGRLSCPYVGGAVLSPYEIRKPKWIRAELYSMFHPFSCIYVNFSLEDDNWEIGRHYEIKESIFRERMKQWGVDLVDSNTGGGSVC